MKILIEKEFENLVEAGRKKSEAHYFRLGHLNYGFSSAYLKAVCQNILDSVLEIENQLKSLMHKYGLQEKSAFAKIKRELDSNRNKLYSKANLLFETHFKPYSDKGKFYDEIKGKFISELSGVNYKSNIELNSILLELQQNKNIFFRIRKWCLDHMLAFLSIIVGILSLILQI